MGGKFWLLFAVSLLMSLGNNIIIPIIPVYAETFGLTSSEIGNVVSYFMLPGIVLQLMSGAVLRWGNRKVILEIAIGIIAFSYAVL